MRYGMGLRLSYRRGKLLAGYLTLPHSVGKRVARSKKTPEGLVIDYADDGTEIGIEIHTPCPECVEALLAMMKQRGLPEPEEELKPLLREFVPA